MRSTVLALLLSCGCAPGMALDELCARREALTGRHVEVRARGAEGVESPLSFELALCECCNDTYLAPAFRCPDGEVVYVDVGPGSSPLSIDDALRSPHVCFTMSGDGVCPRSDECLHELSAEHVVAGTLTRSPTRDRWIIVLDER